MCGWDGGCVWVGGWDSGCARCSTLLQVQLRSICVLACVRDSGCDRLCGGLAREWPDALGGKVASAADTVRQAGRAGFMAHFKPLGPAWPGPASASQPASQPAWTPPLPAAPPPPPHLWPRVVLVHGSEHLQQAERCGGVGAAQQFHHSGRQPALQAHRGQGAGWRRWEHGRSRQWHSAVLWGAKHEHAEAGRS